MAVADIIILQSVKGIIMSVSINSAYSRTGVTSAIEFPSPTNTVRKISNQYLLIAESFSFSFQEKDFLGSLFQVIQKFMEGRKFSDLETQNSVDCF